MKTNKLKFIYLSRVPLHLIIASPAVLHGTVEITISLSLSFSLSLSLYICIYYNVQGKLVTTP